MPKPEQKTHSVVAARFSAAAATYHSLANIQSRVAKKLMTLIAPRPAPARILEIGCGTGLFTEMLARAFPAADIAAVDISPAMTAKARAYLGENKKINWIAEDASELEERGKYPLIASNCSLHWIAPVELIVGKLAGMLAKDGKMAFALMLHGTFSELNSARRRITPLKPSRVTLPTGMDVRKAIKKAGLTIRADDSETIRQEYSSASAMLRQLHDQGLTGGNNPNGGALLSRSELSMLIADYSRHYKCRKGVYATYRVFYCVAARNERTGYKD